MYSQEIIPLQTRASETLKGDMAIIGNSILEIEGLFGGENFTKNQEYYGAANNGRSFFDIRTGYPAYVRSYIDIDSDPSFDTIFSNAFRANPNNFDFGGNLLPPKTGSPAECNKNGTFNSSLSKLDINADCSVVKKSIFVLIRCFLW